MSRMSLPHAQVRTAIKCRSEKFPPLKTESKDGNSVHIIVDHFRVGDDVSATGEDAEDKAQMAFSGRRAEVYR